MRMFKSVTAVVGLGMLTLAACSAGPAASTNTPDVSAGAMSNTAPPMTTKPADAPMPANTPAVTTPANMGNMPNMTTAPANTAPANPTQTTPPAKAGGFVVSNLNIDNEMPAPGENVTVTCKIMNTGMQAGSYKCEVTVDGVVAGTQDVTLAAGGTQTVSFSIVAPKVGGHTVAVGDQTCKLTSMDM